MGANGEAKEVRKYRDNCIDGFRNGAVLDLRVRLGIEVLVHGGLFAALMGALPERAVEADVAALPKVAAAMALEAATELLKLAEERGLVEDFPDGAEIGKGLRDHAKRQAHFQFEGQREAQRVASEQLRPAMVAPLVKPS